MLNRFFNLTLNESSKEVNTPSNEKSSDNDASFVIEGYGSMFPLAQDPQIAKMICRKKDAEFVNQFNELSIKKP